MIERGLTKEKFLSPGEYLHLVGLLDRFGEKDFRNVLLLKMLLHTGARVSEVLNIKVKDLDPETCSVFISGLKNSKDRDIPLTLPIMKDLKILKRGMGLDDLIFPIGYHQARNIWCEYRPVKKKIHCLRHWRAMDVYKRKKDIRLVQTVLGHKFLSTTMIYLEYEYTRDELREALL